MKLGVEQVVLADNTEVDKVCKAVSTKFVPPPVLAKLVVLMLHKRLSNRQEECRRHSLQYLNIIVFQKRHFVKKINVHPTM